MKGIVNMSTFFRGAEAEADRRELLPCPTLRHVWALVKLSKHVRGRCRNNAAFNKYFKELFKGEYDFQAVPKVGANGREYMGLVIVDVRTGKTLEDTEPDSDSDSE